MIKKTFLAILFSCITTFVFSQACGIYYVKYVGQIENNDEEVVKVRLPSIPFLHGLDNEISSDAFLDFKVENNIIDCEMGSHLTSVLYEEAKTYLKFYRSKNDKIPVTFFIKKDDKTIIKKVEIPWKRIKIEKLKDEKLRFILKLDLASININNYKEILSFKDKIFGNWEFDKLLIQGKEIEASTQNHCGYKDVLELKENNKSQDINIENQILYGYKIGKSNTKICTPNPRNNKYNLSNNSCPTEWMLLDNQQNIIVHISEGIVVEYQIYFLNNELMLLSKRNEILNYGEKLPETIRLKKIKLN